MSVRAVLNVAWSFLDEDGRAALDHPEKQRERDFAVLVAAGGEVG